MFKKGGAVLTGSWEEIVRILYKSSMAKGKALFIWLEKNAVPGGESPYGEREAICGAEAIDQVLYDLYLRSLPQEY